MSVSECYEYNPNFSYGTCNACPQDKWVLKDAVKVEEASMAKEKLKQVTATAGTALADGAKRLFNAAVNFVKRKVIKKDPSGQKLVQRDEAIQRAADYHTTHH